MVSMLRELRKKNLAFWSMHLTNQDVIKKYPNSFNVKQKQEKIRPPYENF